MKCMVTGAAGFIGSALVNTLAEKGYVVKAVTHSSKPKHRIKNVEYVKGDITDIDSLKPLVKDVEVVFHCAAHVKDYGPKKPFYDINVGGTKNLVEVCKNGDVKRFIFLSHIRYESNKRYGLYSKTKKIAENVLLDEYKNNKLPIVIIRPGNVYGPGSTIWVLRNIESIKKNRITLVNHGNGIFLHTYIDNLIDALLLAMEKPEAVGKDINVTDGDYTVTYGKYFNDLAELIGEKPITKNLSKTSAMIIAKIMIFLNKVLKIKPWVTPTAVNILTNEQKISIEKAKEILGYRPKIDYEQGMKNIQEWLKKESYI